MTIKQLMEEVEVLRRCYPNVDDYEIRVATADCSAYPFALDVKTTEVNRQTIVEIDCR